VRQERSANLFSNPIDRATILVKSGGSDAAIASGVFEPRRRFKNLVAAVKHASQQFENAAVMQSLQHFKPARIASQLTGACSSGNVVLRGRAWAIPEEWVGPCFSPRV